MIGRDGRGVGNPADQTYTILCLEKGGWRKHAHSCRRPIHFFSKITGSVAQEAILLQTDVLNRISSKRDRFHSIKFKTIFYPPAIMECRLCLRPLCRKHLICKIFPSNDDIGNRRCTVKKIYEIPGFFLTKSSWDWEKSMLRREYYCIFGPIQSMDFSWLEERKSVPLMERKFFPGYGRLYSCSMNFPGIFLTGHMKKAVLAVVFAFRVRTRETKPNRIF
jgi:hypothetical protein